MQQVSADAATVLRANPLYLRRSGCRLLDLDLAVLEDISDDILGGTVKRSMANRIHGTVTLDLTRDLQWGVELVQPYMVLSDGVVDVEFNTGVYCLTTPKRQVGSTPEVRRAQGEDRLYLLDRPVGADYTPANAPVLDLVRQAVTDAGLSGILLDGTAEGETLPVAPQWLLVARTTDPDQTSSPVTWLRVINDLLNTINYRGVWCDENGLFRSEPYRAPSQRAPEWTFDADLSDTLVGPDREEEVDVWGTPNRWVFRASNPPAGVVPSEANGLIYVVENVNGTVLGRTTQASQLTSQNARGLVWADVFDYDVTSADALAGLGGRRVDLDLRTSATRRVPTGPFPAAGHADIFTVRDLALGGEVKVQASEWTLPLDGGLMQWTWEVL